MGSSPDSGIILSSAWLRALPLAPRPPWEPVRTVPPRSAGPPLQRRGSSRQRPSPPREGIPEVGNGQAEMPGLTGRRGVCYEGGRTQPGTKETTMAHHRTIAGALALALTGLALT